MMALSLALAAVVLKVVGLIFICLACLGLLRFADPLQRMHAATKAGTVGAGCMVAGAALATGDGFTMGVAAVTILFLILTVPLAGHLLGRAIYFSGTPLAGLEGRDALAEKECDPALQGGLPRQPATRRANDGVTQTRQ